MTHAIGTVMVVDDEEFDQYVYRRIIDRSGLVGSLVSCLSGREALAALRDPQRPKPDAIFLDINMPGMSGFEFLDAAVAELGEDFAGMVIVMLTTSLDPGDQARAAGYPVVREYFNKPLSVDHLAEVARLLAAGQSAA